MSIRSVVTRGYANGGSIALVAVRGYGKEAGEEELPTGGWAARNVYGAYRQRKRRRDKERKRVLEELRELDAVDQEIGELLHKELATEAREQELAELGKLLSEDFTPEQEDQAQRYDEKAAKAYIRAVLQQNYSAIEAFEREMERARVEEEEFLLIAMVMLQ